MSEIIKIKDVYSGYGKRKILNGINLKIEQGERVLLIGPNGSGKSTLLKTILGIIKPYSGKISYENKNIIGVPTDQIINMGISYLPQTNNIFPSLTVGENLRLSCFFKDEEFFNNKLNFVLNIFPFLRKDLEERAGFLSGGQRQALAVSMALMRDIKLLIIDEPTAGLSPRAAKKILEGIKRVQKIKNLTLIMVEHNIRYLRNMYDRAIIMKEGKIVKEAKVVTKKILEKYFF